jgi:hypothetical protein
MVEKAIEHLMSIGSKFAGVVFNRAQAKDFARSISGISLRSIARHQSTPQQGATTNGNGNGGNGNGGGNNGGEGNGDGNGNGKGAGGGNSGASHGSDNQSSGGAALPGGSGAALGGTNADREGRGGFETGEIVVLGDGVQESGQRRACVRRHAQGGAAGVTIT